jgi:hypothetical protein
MELPPDRTLKPLSKRQIAELRGYVSPGIVLFRAVLFLAALAGVGALARLIQRAVAGPEVLPFWLLVPAIVGIALYRRAGRWTGGSAFRERVRQDLASGMMAVIRIDAVDAIAVSEQGDAGPTFFLLTADGRTMVFTGQYLEPYVAKGFPWRSFEILEGAHSGVFFRLSRIGDPLRPSSTLAPLSWEDSKAAGMLGKEYATLDVPFENIRAGRVTSEGNAGS